MANHTTSKPSLGSTNNSSSIIRGVLGLLLLLSNLEAGPSPHLMEPRPDNQVQHHLLTLRLKIMTPFPNIRRNRYQPGKNLHFRWPRLRFEIQLPNISYIFLSIG